MTRPIAPFDVVVLSAGLPQHGLPPGTRAVVLEIHEEPYEALEIEVVGVNGETLFSGNRVRLPSAGTCPSCERLPTQT